MPDDKMCIKGNRTVRLHEDTTPKGSRCAINMTTPVGKVTITATCLVFSVVIPLSI